MLLKLEGDGPLYTQVYETLRHEIVTGRFPPGARLPGTRSVASALGVSRTVVLLAYSQLESEGYTTTRVGSGTFVAERAPGSDAPGAVPLPRNPDRDTASIPEAAPPPRVPLSRLAARVRHTPPPDHPVELLDDEVGVIDLTDAAVSHDARALKAWRRALSQTMSTLPGERPGSSGALALREVLLDYLHRERGVVANIEDLIIVNSAQQARDLIARVLVDEHTAVGVEEPGDPGIRRAFAAAGAEVVACESADGGMDVERHAPALETARVMHVSPACHLPTGDTMSATRRGALLEWVYARPAHIVEEDFEGDPRHGVHAMPALQGEDRHERVIYYMNGLSRAVYPAMQLSCVVVPPALREKFHALKELSDREGVALRQHAWARYVAEGEYARALRRLSQQFSRKHRILLEALRRHLGDAARVEGSAVTGQMLLHLPQLDAGWMTLLREEALRAGLLLQSAADWYQHPPAHAALLVHYAALAEEHLESAVRRLARACQIVMRDVGQAGGRHLA